MKKKLIAPFIISVVLLSACGNKEIAPETPVDKLNLEETNETNESHTENVADETHIEDEVIEQKVDESDPTEPIVPDVAGENYNWDALEPYEDKTDDIASQPYVKYKEEYTDISKSLEEMSSEDLIAHIYAVSHNAMIDEGFTLSGDNEEIDTIRMDKKGILTEYNYDTAPELTYYIDYVEQMVYKVDGSSIIYMNDTRPFYLKANGYLVFNQMILSDIDYEYSTAIEEKTDTYEINMSIGDTADGEGYTFIIDKDTHRILSMILTYNGELYESIEITYGDVEDINIDDIKQYASPEYTQEELMDQPLY